MKKSLACVSLICLFIAACSGNPDDDTTDSNTSKPSAEGAKYLLSSEPADATEVIKVREDAADGDAVVIVGRIGGSSNPFNEEESFFSIVDTSLKACSDIPGDNCPQPWDYCCEDVTNGTALIMVVNDKGDLLKTNAKELLGVKELSTVVVTGTAERDEAGNLTVLAQGIFVRK